LQGDGTVYATGKMPIQVFGHLASDVIGVTRSTDAGRTFESPRLLLPDPARSIIHVVSGFLVTPDAELILAILAHDVPVRDARLLDNHIWITRSTDAGRTFSEPVAAAPTVVHGNRGDERLMVMSLASTSLALDTSRQSPHSGRLYLSYLSVADGRLQVFVASSDDRGQSWSAPVRVNDDTGTANHSNPFLSVSDGIVAVVWNDRRMAPHPSCFRTTVSASFDGGATFLPSAPMTDGFTCPLGAGGRDASDGFRDRYANGGETQGLAALPGGRFLAVWVDGSSGIMRLRASTMHASRERSER
jgi:hypothetical protein